MENKRKEENILSKTDLNNKAYLVYIHKNKINNKVYVGITSQKPKNRWRNGKGYKDNAHFWNAIRKYGWDNFHHYIIISDITRERACEFEISLIQYYNSRNPKYGYNINKGGDLGKSDVVFVYNKDTGEFVNCYDTIPLASRELNCSTSGISSVATGKAKYCNNYYFSYKDLGTKLPKDILNNIKYNNDTYSPIAQYDLNGNFIKKYSRKIEAIHELFGEDCNKLFDLKSNTAYGYIWKSCSIDEVPPLKLSEEELKNRLTPNYNGCYQYTLDGTFIKEWNTITDAANALGFHLSDLARKCKTVDKYHGYYWARTNNPNVEYGKNLDLSITKKHLPNKCFRRVYQYDFYGNLINEYQTIAEAARKYNVDAEKIRLVCTGKYFQACNFIWRFEKTEFSKEDLCYILNNSRRICFCQYDKNNNFISKYTTKELRDNFKYNKSLIVHASIYNETLYNYRWKIA